MWEIEVRHDGLNKYRHIKGSDRYIVKQKAIAQEQAWEDMWKKKQAAEEKSDNEKLLLGARKRKKIWLFLKLKKLRKQSKG